MTHREIVEGMRKLRKRIKPGKMKVRQMVEEGRRFWPGLLSMRPWRSLGAFQMRQASTQMGTGRVGRARDTGSGTVVG